MKYRNLMLAFGAMALLTPAVMLAAEAESKAEVKSETKAEKPMVAKCGRATGSYLRSTGKDCNTASPMRAYTPEELELTGLRDTNAALRKMDPRFR